MGIPKSVIPRSGVDPQFSEYLCKELEKLWFPKFWSFAKERLEDERKFCGMDEDRWSRLCSSCREWEQVLELVFEENETYFRECVEQCRWEALCVVGCQDSFQWRVANKFAHYVCSPADCGLNRERCPRDMNILMTQVPELIAHL